MDLYTGNGRHFYYWEEGKKLNWYTCRVPHGGPLTQSMVDYYSDVVDWIYDNIENCERHARWTWEDDEIQAKFRYERDLIKFALRWS